MNRLFDEYNAKYFRSRLPRFSVALISFGIVGKEGHCDEERRRILLARELDDGLRRRVLLHEMCHIGTPGHGARFRAKLARLATMGERWADDERRAYERARFEGSSTAQIRRALDDMAVQHPDLRWPTVRRAIARDVLCTTESQKVERVAPWARGVWSRIKAEARAARRLRARLLMTGGHPVLDIEAAAVTIRRWAEANPSVSFVALFGSRVRGTPRTNSDLDIAVSAVMADVIADAKRWERELEELLGFAPVRISSMRDVAAAVEEYGRVVYDRPSDPIDL